MGLRRGRGRLGSAEIERRSPGRALPSLPGVGASREGSQMTSSDLEATQAAFTAGMAAAAEHMAFHSARPGEGVRWPVDLPGSGLHYVTPPPPVPVYAGAQP